MKTVDRSRRRGVEFSPPRCEGPEGTELSAPSGSSSTSVSPAVTTGGLEDQCRLPQRPNAYAFAAVRLCLHIDGSFRMESETFLAMCDQLYELLEVANNHKPA